MVEGNNSSPLTPAWPLSYVQADVSQWLGNSWQLTKCLLTGRSSKFKVEPLPWWRKMHSLLGEGSGWCPATAKNVLYHSALSRTLLPFSFPLRSRSVYQWWGQWRVGSGVAASGLCRNAASAKRRSSHLIDVIGKHIILEFVSALRQVSSLKS